MPQVCFLWHHLGQNDFTISNKLHSGTRPACALHISRTNPAKPWAPAASFRYNLTASQCSAFCLLLVNLPGLTNTVCKVTIQIVGNASSLIISEGVLRYVVLTCRYVLLLFCQANLSASNLKKIFEQKDILSKELDTFNRVKLALEHLIKQTDYEQVRLPCCVPLLQRRLPLGRYFISLTVHIKYWY